MPLGMPLLIGGIRSAALQVLATATLAAYVGAGGLGRFLFLGLKTQNYPMMLASSLVVVLLAVAVEISFEVVDRLVQRTLPVKAAVTSLYRSAGSPHPIARVRRRAGPARVRA